MISFETLIFIVVFASALIGIFGERWRAGSYRKKRQARQFNFVSAAPLVDASDQLRVVMSSPFEACRLLSKSEERVFTATETFISEEKLPWRVMAQVNIGEFVRTPDKHAFSAINSKRVDLLILSESSFPIAAIEYQGSGHYQTSAAARDAVKREALRRAGIEFIEISTKCTPRDLRASLERLSRIHSRAA